MKAQRAWKWSDFERLTVLVVGDVMLDRYLYGSVERISPEAPVPVVQLAGRETRLGGAANVALNVKAMGATPLLCSVIGTDAASEEFLELMRQHELPTEGLLRHPGRPTTAKTRVMAGAQHLLRIDEEITHDLAFNDEQRLLDAALQLLERHAVQVVIFQDYNKGVLTRQVIERLLAEAGRRQIPTAVDPKDRNFWAFKGVSLFKPNLKEIRRQYPGAIQPADLASLQAAAAFIRARLGNYISLITLSDKGIFVEAGDGGCLIPTQPRIIADVSGAGDTVISVASLALALGIAPREMALLANLAGGQVCEKPGVAPLNRKLLEQEYDRM